MKKIESHRPVQFPVDLGDWIGRADERLSLLEAHHNFRLPTWPIVAFSGILGFLTSSLYMLFVLNSLGLLK